ncbi:AMP-binding protein [Massilia sp. W12]|uniref:(2,3-dihydroxybenzoyl)adenylate synthase n=1 Tax=Massilia sp. W12 TaxID=3126507 RepID=UPI0030D060DB
MRIALDLAQAPAWPPERAAAYRAAGLWREEGLGEVLQQSAARWPQLTALVCGQRRYTYAELEQAASACAAGLAAQGLQHGMRVLLQLPNCAEFYIALFACFKAGIVPVMCLPGHRFGDIGAQAQASQARAWLGHANFRDAALPAHCPGVQHWFVLGGDSLAAPWRDFNELRRPDLPPPALPAAGNTALLQLSGGSTGLPKLIARSHADYWYSVRCSNEVCGIDQQTRYLCVLPAAHNFPLSSPGALGVLAAGGCVVLAADASPQPCFALIARERITLTAVTPAIALLWQQFLRSHAGQKRMLHSLQLMQIGGAPLDPAFAAGITPTFGCQLQQVFGMAEGLVNYTRLEDSAQVCAETQGRPMSAWDELRIVDADGKPLPDGACGQLQTRGPYTICGYWNGVSPESFTADGFYSTGDLVRRLPSGHLQVLGRCKDVINRGGEKIAALEIEQHLQAHPAIAAAAVIGLPDPMLGEKSCACIQLRPHAAHPDLGQVRAFLQARGLALFKLPERLELLPALPLTAVGKTDKKALRARFAAGRHLN